MSSALAIAATTAVIQSVLDTGVVNAQLSPVLSNISVSALPPDRIQTGANEPNQLNLFMYQATYNPGWRNVALPARDTRGDRISSPPLALDLHYLLSAYGADDLHAEILLGVGMQLLHEMPVLTREAIRAVFTPAPGDTLSAIMQALAASGIAEQVEMIKVCPWPLNTDELSKLWAAFQDKYRPCAAYSASVVLIESRAPTRSSLPVRKPLVHVTPLRRPFIEAVDPQMVVFSDTAAVILRGRDLLADDTLVRFGSGAEGQPDAGQSTGQRLVVPLPAGVRAGINTLQVVQPLALGEPPAAHRGFESNVAALIVRPIVATRSANGGEEPDITVATTPATGDAPRSGTITVGLRPDVGKQQRVALLLNELDPPDDHAARALTFEAPTRDLPDAPDVTGTISFPVRDLPAGEYLLRVRVDGAESELEVDDDGRFVAPVAEVP
jgi:hypothetical protein